MKWKQKEYKNINETELVLWKDKTETVKLTNQLNSRLQFIIVEKLNGPESI